MPNSSLAPDNNQEEPKEETMDESVNPSLGMHRTISAPVAFGILGIIVIVVAAVITLLWKQLSPEDNSSGTTVNTTQQPANTNTAGTANSNTNTSNTNTATTNTAPSATDSNTNAKGETTNSAVKTNQAVTNENTNAVEETEEPANQSSLELASTYQSKHGFQLKYPAGWNLTSNIDNYDSIAAAQKVGGNHMQIYSYDPNAPELGGGPLPKTKLKMEVYVSDNVTQTLDQWVASDTSGEDNTLKKIEDLIIDGKPAKKVWTMTAFGESVAIYFVDGQKSARFNGYPSNSNYSEEFGQIAKNFQFID